MLDEEVFCATASVPDVFLIVTLTDSVNFSPWCEAGIRLAEAHLCVCTFFSNCWSFFLQLWCTRGASLHIQTGLRTTSRSRWRLSQDCSSFGKIQQTFVLGDDDAGAWVRPLNWELWHLESPEPSELWKLHFEA